MLFRSIDALKDLKDLENLDISGTRVKLLEGLSKAYKLKILNLSRTQIDSIGKLKDLKNITHLHVDRTWVKEFDGIQGLTKMMVLSASWTRVKDLEPLLPLTRLVELYLDGCGAKLEKGLDLSPLKELRSLRRLALWQSGATRQGIGELKRANPHLQVMGCEGPGDWPCK